MSFTPRLTAPSLDNPYYYSNVNPYYANGMGMPNCTCYAWGRAYEILEVRPELPYGNAENWYPNTTAYPTGDEDDDEELGAIMCWENLVEDGGHVAVIEELISNGVVLVSESAYNQWVFRTHTYSYPYNWGNYVFQGFIYLYDTPPPSRLGKKTRFKFVLFNQRRRILYGQ